MKSKFKSKCAETYEVIKKGDGILYDTDTKRAYCEKSEKYKKAYQAKCDAGFVQAQEDAYFDNFQFMDKYGSLK